MPIPPEISAILSELGAPAVAIGLALGLVKGANVLEKSASEPALKYVSDLLLHGSLANVGKLSTTLIPMIFGRVFGSKAVSVRFISCSIFATVLFWLVLLTLRHADWGIIWQDLINNSHNASIVIPMWLIIDWMSLTKARYLLTIMSRKNSLFSVTLFFVLDVVGSYLIPLAGIIILFGIVHVFSPVNVDHIWSIIKIYARLEPISQYFTRQTNNVSLGVVFTPSTLLTSAWTLFLVLTCFIAKLLIPFEHLRRFTAFWFRDVEKYPLTSIAKVAATMIIVCATVLKVIRWA